MNTGVLWFDNSQTALTVKIQKAADYFFKKYGRQPTLCLVHPSMMEAKQRQLEFHKITIRPYRPVLPGHIWIGIEEKQEECHDKNNKAKRASKRKRGKK